MAELVEGVHPTRMELLKTKRKTALAEKGHRLLSEKLDALMMEFMNAARNADEIADNTIHQLMKARDSMLVANSIVGSSELKSLSISSEPLNEVEIRFRKVMGVSLPRVQEVTLQRKPDERKYSIILTNPLVDEVSLEYEKSAECVLRLLEVELTLKSLSKETRKTKRRVNALEYNIIPKLKKTRSYIEMRLAELERESFHRLKIVKRKRG
jgi:V/A-type H+-transporting ATPase subunit D